jgi:ribosome maturation factor RimP
VDVVQEARVKLFDVELSGRILQVYVQSDEGVTIATCARVSQMLSDRLDQTDPIPGRYFLEVSSPGLERRLRGIDDFEHEIGKFAHVVTSQGGFDGTIRRVEGTTISLAVARNDGAETEIVFPMTDVKRANLKVTDGELFARKDKPGKKGSKRRLTDSAASLS